MIHTIEVTFADPEGDDTTEMYGRYASRTRAEQDRDRLRKALEGVPRAEEDPRSVYVHVVPLKALNITEIVAEATRFLEPDESRTNGY